MTNLKKTPGINADQQQLLKKLPGVDHIIEIANNEPALTDTPRALLTDSVRQVLDRLRSSILEDNQTINETDFTDADILKKLKKSLIQPCP